MVGSCIASIFGVDPPVDFIIKRGTPRYKDTTIARTIRIKNALLSGAIINAKKMIVVFRLDNPEFDYEMNIALLYLERGDNEKAAATVDAVRNTLFKRFAGKKIIDQRLDEVSQVPENVGDFYNLPSDVVRMIVGNARS
jgi:hypothetical protein